MVAAEKAACLRKVARGQRESRKPEIQLEEGTIINSGNLIMPQTYLKGYMLVYDPENPPTIAYLDREQFKNLLHKLNDDYVEKIRSFVRELPCFKNFGRKTSRELLYKFTHLRVGKGWTLNSYDELMTRNSGDPLLLEPRRLYIIVSG